MDDHKPNVRCYGDNAKNSQKQPNDRTFMWERCNDIASNRNIEDTKKMEVLAAKLRGICEDAVRA